MAQPHAGPTETERRAFARHRLGLGAWLDTIDGRQPIRMLNLSRGGAQIILSRNAPVREGVIHWLRFETYGVAIWQQGTKLGMAFDRMLSLSCLIETREQAPAVVREEALGAEHAAHDWVDGKSTR